MKNLSKSIRIGILALTIGVFSSTILMANGTSGEEAEKVKSKDQIAVEKLEASIIEDDELMKLEIDLEEEGIISCCKDMVVVILNSADEVVYEGTYSGISIVDKTLKKYMAKADLLVNVENVAYYMLF